MVGAITYAIGTCLMAVADTPFLFHLNAGILVGIGIAMSSFGIVMAALGRVVPPERRSWAFGIATASGSLGQFIFAPMGAALISAHGWQTALVILGLSSLLIVIFAVPLLVQNTSSSKISKDEADITMRAAVGGAFAYRSYVLLVAGFFVCGFHLAFITVHLPPYLAEHGISKEFAGLAMGTIGLFYVAGSYASGIVGGKFHKRVPLSAIYILRSLSIIGFISFPITTTSTIIFTATMGFLWLSTVPLTMGLVIVMFGTCCMATLYGFVFLSHQVGSFLGVWLGGWLYDRYGNYDVVWWLSIGLGLFAALVNLPIKETRAPKFVVA